MRGLEATELPLSQIKTENGVLRVDSEYFQKEATESVARLISIGARKIIDLAEVTDGIHESIPFVENGPVRVISAKHPKDNFIEAANCETISLEYHRANPRTALRNGDVLISTVGTIGNVAVVTDDLLPANSDRHVGIIRPKATISPFYLSSFLVGKYGRLQAVRETTGNVQPNLFIVKIEQILCPRFSGGFEGKVSAVCERGYSLRKKAALDLGRAEQTLLRALGLESWRPPEPLTYSRKASEAFGAGRLDAEFFEPKYTELITRVKRSCEHFRVVSDIQILNQRGLQPIYDKNGKLSVITSKHILNSGLNYGEFDRTDASNWVKQRKARVLRNDILTYSTGANIGRTAIYASDERALASNHVNILRIHGENAEYVAFVMNSTIGRLQTQRLCAGSAQAELYPKDIAAFVIPFVHRERQDDILAKNEQARQNRLRASLLLDSAKRAVEIAIERDEATALAYLADREAALR